MGDREIALTYHNSWRGQIEGRFVGRRLNRKSHDDDDPGTSRVCSGFKLCSTASSDKAEFIASNSNSRVILRDALKRMGRS
jgi:hypothetical protein